MAKYKVHHRKQLMMIPVSLEDQLQPGTLEDAIDYLIGNRMHLSIFDKQHKNDD